MRRMIIAAVLTALILLWGKDFYLVGEAADFDWKVFVIMLTLGGMASYKLVDYLAQFKSWNITRGLTSYLWLL